MGGRTWLRNSETLVFAVGEANGPEARFAARLATVLKNSSRLRLKIVPNGDNAKALSQFDRKEANPRYCAPTPGYRPAPARWRSSNTTCFC